ncbi:MAG: cell division protein ZapA [Tissierellia bacterium]|nr:cell division protein ZapA [Tissierellia bacterium]
MVDRNSYEVQIGNDNYLLRTKRSKEETDKIVKYVDTELKAAKKQLKYRNPAMHATLACLNIADTLYSISHDYDQLKKDSDLPMKEYGPLKLKYEDLLIRENNGHQKIAALEKRVAQMQEQIEELDEKNKQLEQARDKNQDEVSKYKERIEFLTDKLVDQEKETLSAYKQLQEAINRSGNK